MIKLSHEERCYLLKTACDAFEAFSVDCDMEKQAALMNIPFIKTFAGRVSENTMNLWKRQYNVAMKSPTPIMSKYTERIGDAAAKANGEGRVALDGVQRIIHHVHGVGNMPMWNPNDYGALGQNLFPGE